MTGKTKPEAGSTESVLPKPKEKEEEKKKIIPDRNHGSLKKLMGKLNKKPPKNKCKSKFLTLQDLQNQYVLAVTGKGNE